MYLFQKETLVSPAINNKLISIVEQIDDNEYSILTYTTEKGVWKEVFENTVEAAIEAAEKAHKKYVAQYI
jgi:hypothetical protein